MPWSLYHREFVIGTVWWEGDDGAFYIAGASVDEEVDYGNPISSVKGFTRLLAKIEPCGEIGANDRYNQCQMIYTQIVDANGYTPSFVVNPKYHRF